MNIHQAIAEHPNLLNNYRRAALCFILAKDMASRGEFGERRDRHIFKGGHYLGTAQGWLFKRYGTTICGMEYTLQLMYAMLGNSKNAPTL